VSLSWLQEREVLMPHLILNTSILLRKGRVKNKGKVNYIQLPSPFTRRGQGEVVPKQEKCNFRE